MKTIKKILVGLFFYTHAIHGSEHIEKLLSPVIFTPLGIEQFFQERFNQQLYTQKLLHSSFIHMIDFFEFGQANKKPRAFTLDVIDIFHTRLKECLWVNPYALAQLLSHIPNTLHDLCLTDREETKQAIKKALYDTLLTQWQALKNDPEKVLGDLADEVYEIAHPEKDSEIIELQNNMIKFIESALNKIVWDPSEQIETFNCFKLLGEQLKGIHACMSIEPTRSLNQLYWSLVYRYCYFMETMALEISIDTYKKIKESLVHRESEWLFVDETDALLTPKIKHLTNCIMSCEARAQAQAAGLTI